MCLCVFFFKQKTAYEIMPSLVGSEMCIRDRYQSPPKISKDASTLKVLVMRLGDVIGIRRKELKGDENGYCKEVFFHFGRIHIKQIVETTYPCTLRCYPVSYTHLTLPTIYSA
eukprot:TRINITY_DN20362_c0_g1_i1.p2 TRINITY_DN20362_c0_g1~~TRINITY_DN20362_c0_g1_i1.p2  ORF type:complete len:113 (+),score=21.60 TRINITY_DN20362_c0_g1_i1:15-353(+)